MRPSNAAARLSSKAVGFCGKFLADLQDCAGLPFKKVAAVGATAVKNLPKARQHIGGQKEQTPLLVLTDVHLFVRSQDTKLCLVNSDNDMAQRHGAKAHRLRQCGDDTAESAAVKLGYARDETQ